MSISALLRNSRLYVTPLNMPTLPLFSVTGRHRLLRSHRTLAIMLLFALVQCGPPSSAAQVSNPAEQIGAALQASPSEHRETAKVYGFADDGTFVTLREGSGDLICIADDPGREGWTVACYHSSLEPYMAMGRDLRAQGITDNLAQRRWEAADAGTLSMPDKPATLYVMTGDRYDVENDEVINAYLRYVIYSPWATAESTGLATRPEGPAQPWLMFPGTAGAHIMVSPPKPEN